MVIALESAMTSSNDERAADRTQRERDLFLRLLELGEEREREPFLKQALALVGELAGAQNAYLELRDDVDDDLDPWFIAQGFSDDELEQVRSRISSGIIAEAMATGQTVETASAMLDERFAERASVRGQKIEAVLCVPVGADPVCGVLYLQGREGPGPFAEEDRSSAEVFARHLAPLASNLLARHRSERASDPTQPYRERLQLEGLVGRSAALGRLFHDVSLVAPLEVSVLLTGDSGTGKSAIARVIHANGPRAAMPLIELNCAALPDTLIESELFGALPGSHSTATRELRGKVAAADGGTLFLDEVGELSANAQAKLLQLLQSGEYFPLGATESVRGNVRVIAATNADLEGEVEAGRFREDLFYRLQVLPVRVPSLSERPDDVAILAAHFANEACGRHALPALDLSREAARAVAIADWPGNVRQLAHAIEAAAIRAGGEGASAIGTSHVFPERAVAPEHEGEASQSFHDATRAFQLQLVRDTLADTGWNVAEAARRLELARSHLYNLIRAFGLSRDES